MSCYFMKESFKKREREIERNTYLHTDIKIHAEKTRERGRGKANTYIRPRVEKRKRKIKPTHEKKNIYRERDRVRERKMIQK